MANPRDNRFRNVFKVNRKTFFDPASWIDVTALSGLNATIMDTIRSSFMLPKPPAEGEAPPPETFEESIKKQGLTEADLRSTAKTYKTFAIVFTLFAAADFFYTIYLLLFHFSILGFVLGISTSALFLGQAFRFDFWAYQIKKRKLGVTFAEWRQHIMGQKGSTS